MQKHDWISLMLQDLEDYSNKHDLKELALSLNELNVRFFVKEEPIPEKQAFFLRSKPEKLN